MFLLFDVAGNVGHGLDGLDGILSIGGFAAEHNGVGAVVDGVGHVGNLRAGGAGVVDHTVQHLGGGDDGFHAADAGADHLLLDAWNLLGRDFDAQVAARNHHAVGDIENGVEVVYPFAVFDLGDDFDRAFAHIENALDRHHVVAAAHEGVGDELDVGRGCPVDELAVFFGECGHVELDAGHVDAFAVLDFTVVCNRADELGFGLAGDDELDFPVVDEDGAFDGYLLRKVLVADPEPSFGGVATGDADGVAGLELDGFGNFASAHFRPFGIDQDADAVGYGANIGNDGFGFVGADMGGIQAGDVHAAIDEAADEFGVATVPGDRADDFGLFAMHGSSLLEKGSNAF